MNLREELHITKDMEPGQEIMLAVLLTREYLGRLSDERLFKPAGITDQQFNVLRILRGGPPEGYLIRELRRRMISHSADMPRLVERMVRAGLVQRREDPSDRRGSLVRLTPEGEALEARLAPVHSDLCREVASLLEEWGSKALLGLLEQMREGINGRLAPPR
ncbi:MAG: MarR family winged helix-turn-helix transcriptional regulator [Holophaga sp.]|jgi:DNA-binding MarR family transcriptional regulator